MTLRLKLYLGFVATIVLALLACSLSLWSIRQLNSQVVSLTERTMPVVRAVLSMKIAMYEVQTQERLYMLANDDDSRAFTIMLLIAATRVPKPPGKRAWPLEPDVFFVGWRVLK